MRTGARYLSEVIDLDKNELLKIQQLGNKSVDEIVDLHDKLKNLNRSEVIRFCCGNGKADVVTSDELNTNNIISIVKGTYVEASDFVCINSVGERVSDCDISISDFSTRTYNSIKRAHINTIKELALYSNGVFLKLPGIGKTSYDEVFLFIQERTIIEKVRSACCVQDEIDETIEKICAYFAPCVSEEISELSKNMLIKQIMDINNSDGTKLPVDENLLRAILRKEPIKQLIQNKILQIVGNSIFDFVTIDDCRMALARIDAIDDSAVEWLINDLIETNQIRIRSGYLFDTTISFEEWVTSLDEKYRHIIVERCQGKTLEEIGARVGVTRERVRQIISKIIYRKPRLLEDGCRDIFTRYYFKDEEFQILFGVEPIIIEYLNLAYKKGHGDVKDFYEDNTIPQVCRNRSNAAFGKRYLITELGEIIRINREELMRWFLKKYYSDKEVIICDFNKAYSEWLSSYGLDDNKSLFYANERSLESNISRLDFCLLKQGKRIRYFDVMNVNIEKLLEDVQISQYKGYEISTYKLFIDNSELMQLLDIRDEYELHNILRKHPVVIKKYDIEIGRMPIVSIGKSDRDKQVRDLLYQLAPIGYYDLALEYEIRYGVRKETVLANFLTNVMVYLDGDTFKVDQPSLSLEEFTKLKEALTADFYLLNDLAVVFSNVIGQGKDELLNPMNIKELGYKLYSQFVVSNNFLTADAYFSVLLKKKEEFDLNEFAVGVRSIQAFGNRFREMRDNLELIEIAKNRFATLDHVCSLVNNCDKESLMVIGRRLSEISLDSLFSIAVQDISSDINPYIDSFNSIYFYNSLIRIQNGIHSAVVGDVCLVSRGDVEPSTKSILVELLKKNEKMSFDRLVELSFEKYRVATNKYRIAYLLDNTDGIIVDLVLETAGIESKKEEKVFWRNSAYEKTIIAKYSALLTSTDRIENIYKLDYFRPFIHYCNMNEIVYMKDLLELDLEDILNSLGLSNPVITEVVDLFFHWVDGINNQTNEAREILDLFFK